RARRGLGVFDDEPVNEGGEVVVVVAPEPCPEPLAGEFGGVESTAAFDDVGPPLQGRIDRLRVGPSERLAQLSLPHLLGGHPGRDGSWGPRRGRWITAHSAVLSL